jgi:hypothetical protein
MVAARAIAGFQEWRTARDELAAIRIEAEYVEFLSSLVGKR